MNEVKVFTNDEFGKVRTVMIDGEPWFVGKDIAEALGYVNTNDAIARSVDDEDKTDGVAFPDAIGRKQNHIVINESGVYSLIMSSKLPTAKKFKRWVTSEVLPSIRKNGEYKKTDSYAIEDPVERAKRWIEEQEEKNRQIRELSDRNKKLEPKAFVFDQIIDSQMLVNFRDAAKELGISQTQFTGWLMEAGYIYKTSAGEIRPMEKFMESGLFEVKSYQNPYNNYSGVRTFLTAKGVATFRVLLHRRGDNRYTMGKHGGKKRR